MLELRCRHNRKAAEVDASSIAVVYKCRTCTEVQGRPVFHKWALADLIRAIATGQVEGVVFPSEDVTTPHQH
jgi:hypothetical protein